MILAILSDIHGNLEALESAIKKIDQIKPDILYCLGDIVGYAANPNECCEIIKERADKVVLGNHDAASAGLMDFSWFNTVAVQSLDWTSEMLTDANRDWLRGLPLSFNNNDLIFSHAMLYKKEEFYYDDELIPIFYSFKEMGVEYKVSFIGHSHKYNILKADRVTDKLENWMSPEELIIEDNYKYIINVGSIGQPRDQDSRGSFILYDESIKKITILRVEYDIEKTAKKILENNLPPILAERLYLGI